MTSGMRLVGLYIYIFVCLYIHWLRKTSIYIIISFCMVGQLPCPTAEWSEGGGGDSAPQF